VNLGKRFFRPHLVHDASGEKLTNPQAPDADAADRFRSVMLPHLDAAYNFARYLTRDASAAEDVVQDAFMRAFRAFATYQGGSAKAWLLAIVRNCFHDRIKAQGLAQPIDYAEGGADAINDETPESLLLQKRDIALVRSTVESLPEPFRETLVLRELEELSYKEIAALTAVPIGTVMSRLARARDMLGALLIGEAAENREAKA
jgi:RNA polymerase sigma-70 factor (ECF subfamily)